MKLREKEKSHTGPKYDESNTEEKLTSCKIKVIAFLRISEMQACEVEMDASSYI